MCDVDVPSPSLLDREFMKVRKRCVVLAKCYVVVFSRELSSKKSLCALLFLTGVSTCVYVTSYYAFIWLQSPFQRPGRLVYLRQMLHACLEDRVVTFCNVLYASASLVCMCAKCVSCRLWGPVFCRTCSMSHNSGWHIFRACQLQDNNIKGCRMNTETRSERWTETYAVCK